MQIGCALPLPCPTALRVFPSPCPPLSVLFSSLSVSPLSVLVFLCVFGKVGMRVHVIDDFFLWGFGKRFGEWFASVCGTVDSLCSSGLRHRRCFIALLPLLDVICLDSFGWWTRSTVFFCSFSGVCAAADVCCYRWISSVMCLYLFDFNIFWSWDCSVVLSTWIDLVVGSSRFQ